MADKVDKPKKQKAKAKQGDKGVLAALPSTRPERIGSRRGASAPAPKTTTTTAASAAAKTKPGAKPAAGKSRAASKPRAAASTRAGAKPRAAAGKSRAASKPRAAASTRAGAKPRATAKPTRTSKPRATAARRKAAAPRTFEPTPAAEAAAIPLHETPPVGEEPTYPRPRPVREGAPGIGTGYRDESASEPSRPSGVQLAATAVRAAGEVAQLGVTLGGELLKGVVKRLPRP